MPSFFQRDNAPSPVRHRRDLMLLVQVAGLMGTAWLVWSISLVPRLNGETLGSVITRTLSYALFACLASAAITLSLYLLIAWSFRGDAIRMALRTSSTAVWFAAATILLAQLSPATLPAALVLVVSTTRLLHSQWRLAHPADPPPFAPIPHPIFDPPPSPRFRELIPGLIASVAAEAALLIFPMGYPLLASALFCLSVAMVTLCALGAGVFRAEAPVNLPRSFLGLLLTVVLATGLTVGSLASAPGSGSYWHSPIQSRPGPLQSARALLHKLFDENSEALSKYPATNLYFPPLGSVEIADNSYPGVILLPETRLEQPVLIEPSSSWNRTSPSLAAIKPFSLPFSGVYWIYRSPFDRPPPTSHVQEGKPLSLSFRTTDHLPMFMEAYQKLGRAIDTKCCTGIQVAISSTDRYPGTIALELVLIDTESPPQPMLSLGSKAVTTWPRDGSSGNGKNPASEILDFLIPPYGPLQHFNIIKLIFHRDVLRRDTSARVSIDRFVFLPR